jgi:uncharacterized membrane protein
MTIYPRLTTFVCGLAATAVLSAVISAPAQALTVSPNRLTPSVAAGETTEKKIQITNETDTDQTYEVKLVPFALDANGHLLIDQGDATAVAWVSLDQTSVTVTPQATLELTATLNVPGDAVPGGYAVAVQVTPPLGSTEAESITRLYLTVKGELAPAATISEVTTAKGVYAPGDQIPFHIEMKNEGLTHITPIGQIDLYRGSDWVGEIKLNETKEIVLPGSTRVFDVTWNSTLGFGKYTAVVTLNGENNLSITSAPLTFWVLSWERMIPVIVLLVTFLIAASVLLRHPSKG